MFRSHGFLMRTSGLGNVGTASVSVVGSQNKYCVFLFFKISVEPSNVALATFFLAILMLSLIC